MDRHYERTVIIAVPPEEVFARMDDPSQLSSHMSRSSWMMGGGHMDMTTDAGRGRHVGSRIRLRGRVLGLDLALEEIVTEREPPRRKAWETIGAPELLVIGSYRMGFDIEPHGSGSLLRLFIDYDLPKRRRWLGHLLGPMYAKWCVDQMSKGARASGATAPRAASPIG